MFQEYFPQLFNLLFTFLLMAFQPHVNLLFMSCGHLTFIPSTTRDRGVQQEPRPEAERVQLGLCHREGDWTVTGLSSWHGVRRREVPKCARHAGNEGMQTQSSDAGSEIGLPVWYPHTTSLPE